MSLDIPRRWEPKIDEIAQAQHITTDEALRIVQAGVERFQPNQDHANIPIRRSYASFFGAIKNGYGSPEAVDRAIEEMRSSA